MLSADGPEALARHSNQPHMDVADPPLVSIGIPTRNRARTYLPDALASATAQTYPKLEIIVADNGSMDETEEVVRALRDSRIRYFRHTEARDANANFNFCLRQATGDYFLLLHDDDLIDRDFVQACLQAAGFRTGVGIIRTGTRVIDAQGRVLREHPNAVVGASTEEFFRAWFEARTTIYFCSTLFGTNALRQTGGFASPRSVFQDAFAVARLAAAYGRVDVEGVKASFRRHGLSRTFSTTVRDWCEDSFALIELMCGLAPETKTLRAEGMRFFADLNYRRAAEARSPLLRLVGYGLVYRRFRYRYAPSMTQLYAVIEGTRLFSSLRYAKRIVARSFSMGG